jgi:transcriptional regulator with XRE-family HTH domain
MKKALGSVFVATTHWTLHISKFTFQALSCPSRLKVVATRKEVGGLIRRLLSRREMTQGTLASLTGIHRTYLSRDERRQVMPSIIALMQIACALEFERYCCACAERPIDSEQPWMCRVRHILDWRVALSSTNPWDDQLTMPFISIRAHEVIRPQVICILRRPQPYARCILNHSRLRGFPLVGLIPHICRLINPSQKTVRTTDREPHCMAGRAQGFLLCPYEVIPSRARSSW